MSSSVGSQHSAERAFVGQLMRLELLVRNELAALPDRIAARVASEVLGVVRPGEVPRWLQVQSGHVSIPPPDADTTTLSLDNTCSTEQVRQSGFAGGTFLPSLPPAAVRGVVLGQTPGPTSAVVSGNAMQGVQMLSHQPLNPDEAPCWAESGTTLDEMLREPEIQVAVWTSNPQTEDDLVSGEAPPVDDATVASEAHRITNAPMDQRVLVPLTPALPDTPPAIPCQGEEFGWSLNANLGQPQGVTPDGIGSASSADGVDDGVAQPPPMSMDCGAVPQSRFFGRIHGPQDEVLMRTMEQITRNQQTKKTQEEKHAHLKRLSCEFDALDEKGDEALQTRPPMFAVVNFQEFCENAKKDPRQCFRSFVDGPLFTGITSLVILANTVYIGSQSDSRMEREVARLHQSATPDAASNFDYFFTVFFVIELLMRLTAQRMEFFCGKDTAWNLFDAVLIASGLTEMFNTTGGSFTVWRVFRVVRVIRMARLMKVIKQCAFLKSLNTMAFAIINCCAPFFWAVVILMLIIYAFANFFMSAIAAHFAGKEAGDVDSTTRLLEENYGSVYATMVLLFKGVSGGADWGELSEPLKGVSEGYFICFSLYILFVSLGVLNVVTGFFVDGTMQATLDTREEDILKKMDRKRFMVQILRQLFSIIDVNESGTLTMNDLEDHYEEPMLQETFTALGLEFIDASSLFNLLDLGSVGIVSIDTFVEVCLHATGTMMNMDICSILFLNRRILSTIESIQSRLQVVPEHTPAFHHREECMKTKPAVAPGVLAQPGMPVPDIPLAVPASGSGAEKPVSDCLRIGQSL
eukprot:NODE_297_length_3207_cov_15.753571.p1 GENE.NODE_297_length_3207_cov_15.753571~~NODE_297_length_3207_cov_15.753571.p1  ORF type:complete len:863 (+),score=208.28 NODE_297_length_3207_cov_15.753571:175-2589(+)